MATITNTTTDANGNVIINVSSSADDAITLATAGTYSDKNIIFNMTFDTPFKPEGKSYLTFSSPNSFTLKVNDDTKHWDGTLEYFSSDKTWTVWDGTITLTAVDNDGEYVLYLRGTGNTVITGNGLNYKWVLTGSNISCVGNIENLLDYVTVEAGNHPTMADYCYQYMFFDCTGLTQAPALPAMTLTKYCYKSMFRGCTSLTKAPSLPATTMTTYCYYYMFRGCTSLTKAPFLPATTLASTCYSGMFYGCTSLTQAPTLPTTMLASDCYSNMFQGCTGLTQAPDLPATTLANYCYANMFDGCTSLTTVPALPATTLAEGCYQYMFNRCTSLKLSSTKTDEYTQEYRIPSSETGTTATDALTDMFSRTGGTFTGTPEINTTYYLSSDNMIVHETEIATLNGYVGSMINAITPESIGTVPTSRTVNGKALSSNITLSASDVGAAASSHTHSEYAASNHTHSGYAASSHNQAASTITNGTFAATGVKAATGTDYTTARIRNIQASTTDLTAGSSSLSNGNIYVVYE